MPLFIRAPCWPQGTSGIQELVGGRITSSLGTCAPVRHSGNPHAHVRSVDRGHRSQSPPRPGVSRNAGKLAASSAETGSGDSSRERGLYSEPPPPWGHTQAGGRPPGQQRPVLARTYPWRPPMQPPLADSASLERLPSAPPTPSVLTASSAGGSQFKFNHEKGRTDATGDIFLAILGENRNLGPREELCKGSRHPPP